ncbi:MAG TPA: hypothetical protein PJ981_15785 [Accumulibacter sp.]|nr:hypothetical protein [Accumulibacter sp.]
MPISARASQLSELLHRFLALEPEKFFANAPPFSEFDGANVPEVSAQLSFLRSTYEPLLSSGQLQQLSFVVVTQLQVLLNSVFNQFDQLVRSRDQGAYQNFAQQLDNFIFHTAMYGIPYVAAGGAHLESTRAALQIELDRAKQNNAEVDALKAAVHNLITPAVAGSLSQSFTKRRNVLLLGRLGWMVASIGLGLYATASTHDLVNNITSNLNPRASTAGIVDWTFWGMVFIRTMILVPIFAAFGFAFSQYRKEREYEEEYAHKAAVAHSLPNYGDLAREPAVRDQIVTAATGVIFVSPGEQARRAERSSAMLGEFKEMVESLTKAVAKK